MPEYVYAEFAGDRAASAPLSWGQQAIWKAVLSLAPTDHVLNMRHVLAVSARAAVCPQTVARAVGELISRHESLRTNIRPGDGAPQQVTVRAGRLRIPVAELDAESAEAGAKALRNSMARVGFDHAAELPLRVAVVTVEALVRHIVVVCNHVAVDRHATDLVLRELRLLLRGPLRGAPGIQPVDLARRQIETDQHRTRRAVEHWARAYDQIPREMLGPADPALPLQFRQARFTSAALGPAVARIAARHRVSSSTVLLAATGALLGALTGHRTCGLLTEVSNRHQPGHADVVAPMTQLGLFALDVQGWHDFDELVPRSWSAALAAYRNAYYDQAALDRALRDEVGRGYAAEIDPYCMFNDDRRAAPAGAPLAGVAAGEEAVRAALARSELEWREFDQYNWRFCLDIHDAAGARGPGTAWAGAPAVLVWLVSDGRYLPPDRVEEFVRSLERLVVEAAFRTVRPTELASLVG